MCSGPHRWVQRARTRGYRLGTGGLGGGFTVDLKSIVTLSPAWRSTLRDRSMVLPPSVHRARTVTVAS